MLTGNVGNKGGREAEKHGGKKELQGEYRAGEGEIGQRLAE